MGQRPGELSQAVTKEGKKECARLQSVRSTIFFWSRAPRVPRRESRSEKSFRYFGGLERLLLGGCLYRPRGTRPQRITEHRPDLSRLPSTLRSRRETRHKTRDTRHEIRDTRSKSPRGLLDVSAMCPRRLLDVSVTSPGAAQGLLDVSSTSPRLLLEVSSTSPRRIFDVF